MINTNFSARTRSLFISSLLSALALAFSASAFAGVDLTASSPGNCYVSGGYEVCYGYMAGIRNQTAEYARRAVFGYTSASTAYFYMELNGANYSCNAPSSMFDAIKTAMASSGYFMIQYNISTGVCSYLALQTGSSERNASAL